MAVPNGRRLGSVAAELVSLQKSQEDTTVAVKETSSLIREQLDLTKQGRLDALEAAAEARRMSTAGGKGGGRKGKSGGGGLLDFLRNPIAGLTGMLAGLTSALAMPALAAVAYSLTGFDNVIKALRVPYYIDVLKDTFKAFTTSIKAITRAVNAVIDGAKAIPENLPKIKITFPENFKIKLPEIPRPQFLYKGIAYAQDAIDKLRKFFYLDLPEIPRPQLFHKGVAYAADQLEDLKKMFRITLPEIPRPAFMVAGVAYTADKFADLQKAWSNIKLPNLAGAFDNLPKIEIEIPQGLKDKFATIKEVFGKVGDAAGKGGSGLLGFIKTLGGFADKLLTPIKAIARVALGPITIAIVGLIDFFVGFWQGWSAEAEDDTATMGSKLLAGMEGGFLGFIKGITKGFEFLFRDIPAWLLDQFGMENIANVLRGFSLTALVDPIWYGIKNIVQFVGNNFTLMIKSFGALFDYQLTNISNSFKNAFTRLGVFISNIGDEIYLLIAKNFRFTIPEVRIPETMFTPSFQLIPEIKVGVGTAQTIQDAEERIDYRRARALGTINARDNEVAAKLKELQELSNQLQNQFQNQLAQYNNQINSGNDNSTQIVNNYGGGGDPTPSDRAIIEGVGN